MTYSKLASYYLHWISKINLWSYVKGNNKTCIDLNKVHPRVKYTHTHMRSKIHLPFIIYCGVEKDNTLLTFDGVENQLLTIFFVSFFLLSLATPKSYTIPLSLRLFPIAKKSGFFFCTEKLKIFECLRH
jgi:hypothetical protein